MSDSIRKSNYELLRILCILGILCMHIYGYIYNEAAGINRAAGVIINSICNANVSIFFLISGYFGIKSEGKKLLILEYTVLFYSLLDLLCIFFEAGYVNYHGVIKSIFPILNGKYWFITCYLVIACFAKYIDYIIDKMSKNNLKKIIFLSLLFFSIAPTIFVNEITGDAGKGVLNMGLIYVIGRYFAYYGIPKKISKWASVLVIGLSGLAILLNAICSMVYRGKGIYVPFARDNSFLIIGLAVSVFVIWSKKDFYSKIINRFATYVFAVYLAEGTIRRIINNIWPFSNYYDTWYMLGIIMVWIIIIVIVVCLVETIRRLVFSKVEIIVAEFTMKKINKISALVDKESAEE